jgi:hypothetical protein
MGKTSKTSKTGTVTASHAGHAGHAGTVATIDDARGVAAALSDEVFFSMHIHDGARLKRAKASLKMAKRILGELEAAASMGVRHG